MSPFYNKNVYIVSRFLFIKRLF